MQALEFYQSEIDIMQSYCRDCNVELIVDVNWFASSKKYNSYVCKCCQSKKCRIWDKANPEKSKESKRNWIKKNPKYMKDWAKDNSDKVNANTKKYQHTKKGKLAIAKGCAKRRNGLGYEIIFNNIFDKSIPVVRHHASDAFLFYIPKELHLKHMHGTNTKLHRDELKHYIESMYSISYIIC